MNNILQKLIDAIKDFMLKTSIAPVEIKDPLTPPRLVLPPKVPKPESIQEMCARVCAEENLNSQLTYELLKTINCESGYNLSCVHPNIVNGKISSTDYGICQINDYWHIGPKKDFPSVDYVMKNPEACVRWMAKMFKAGKADLWVCHQKLFKK